MLAGCTPSSVDRSSAAKPDSAAARAAAAPTPAVPASAPVTPAAVVPTVHLALSGEGLTFVADTGSTRHVEFGVPAPLAIEAATRTLGAAPTSTRNEECGAGPLDMATWPNGLTLAMQDARLVGWSLHPPTRPGDSSSPTTLSGIGLGSTRRELEAAYAAQVGETTLGTEFQAGGLYGVLDGPSPDARIDALWAGTGCVFR